MFPNTSKLIFVNFRCFRVQCYTRPVAAVTAAGIRESETL